MVLLQTLREGEPVLGSKYWAILHCVVLLALFAGVLCGLDSMARMAKGAWVLNASMCLSFVKSGRVWVPK